MKELLDETKMKTGFKDLDEIINLNEPKLIAVGARPAMGKTSFALNIASNLALHQDIATLFISLEGNFLISDMKDLSYNELMKYRENNIGICLAEKIIASEEMCNLDMFNKIRNKRDMELNDEKDNIKDFEPKVKNGIKRIKNSKLFIEDKAPQTIDEITSTIKQYVQKEDIKVAIIDYLQLIQGNKNLKREQEISRISLSLKNLSKELDIPIIILSQFSRNVEERDDKRPNLRDFEYSYALVQDTNIIILLYRDDYYDKDSEKKNVAEIIVAKNRNGDCGTIDLAWLPSYTKFANLDRRFFE